MEIILKDPYTVTMHKKQRVLDSRFEPVLGDWRGGIPNPFRPFACHKLRIRDDPMESSSSLKNNLETRCTQSAPVFAH